MAVETQAMAAPLGVVGTYEELIAICREQVQRLNINYQILDIAAGFNSGYATKLFAVSDYSSGGGRRTKRYLSGDSFDAYLEALGLDLVVVENPAKVARLKAFTRSKLLMREGPKRATAPSEIIKLTHDFVRKIGRKGGLASGRKRRAAALARERISKINRRNALKRWQNQNAM